MVFGIAGGEVKGVLVALGAVVASEGKAGRVEMRKAVLHAFLGTASQSQRATQPITPIGMDFIERPTELKTREHLGMDTRTQEPRERCVGKKLRRQGQGLIGTPQAIEEHPSPRFAWGDLLLRIRHEARINHAYQASIFSHTGNAP